MVRADIYPIKRIEGGVTADILAELQAVMAGSPPPWLAKQLGVAAEQRVRFSRSDEVL
ncbi:hypothetical protein D3C85_1704380 [compost metagenome]